jgi:hypothetical protein
MRLENCKPGVKVKVLSKSIGEDIRILDGGNIGYVKKIIANIHEYYGHVDVKEFVEVHVHVTSGQYAQSGYYECNFLPHDLEPLWEEGE